MTLKQYFSLFLFIIPFTFYITTVTKTFADESKLHPTNQKYDGVKYRAFIAAKINNIRLIDNINLN